MLIGILIFFLEILSAQAAEQRVNPALLNAVEHFVCHPYADLRVFEDRSYVCTVNGERVPVRLYIDNGR